MKHSVFRLICGLTFSVILTGCSLLSLTPNPSPQTYLLDMPFATDVPKSNSNMTLIVSMPAAAPGFNTARMVFVSKTNVLEYFAFNQWVDTPAKMLMPLLMHSLERSGQFAQVIAAPSSVIGTLRLDTEILRLQQEFTTQPSQVRLLVRATLLDIDARRIIASQLFEETVESPGDNAESGAAAANQAIVSWLEKLTNFVSVAMANDSQKTPQ